MAKKKAKTETKVAEVRVEEMPLEKLRAHPQNYRKHPRKNSPKYKAVKNSMLAGLISPVVFNKRNGFLVSGHLRVKIADDLGWKTLPASIVDYDEDTHLARMVAANTQAGAYDPELQKLVVKETVDANTLELTSLTNEELQRVLGLGEVDTAPKLERAVYQVVVKFDSQAVMDKFVSEMEKEGRTAKRFAV